MSWMSTEMPGFLASNAFTICCMPASWAWSQMPYEMVVRPRPPDEVEPEAPPPLSHAATRGVAASAPARSVLLRIRASGG
ncbi:hypothetical protein [Streptomyces sp. NPDC055140]